MAAAYPDSPPRAPDPNPVRSLESGTPSNAPNINVTLLEAEIWSAFHELTNEMIVTKAGRCVTRFTKSQG